MKAVLVMLFILTHPLPFPCEGKGGLIGVYFESGVHFFTSLYVFFSPFPAASGKGGLVAHSDVFYRKGMGNKSGIIASHNIIFYKELPP